MPAEDVKNFMAKVKKDARLRKKLQKEATATANRVVKIAKEHGFKVTKAELHDHLKKEWGAKKAPTSKKAATFIVVAP
jgi:predicted ribosomally synthesized peptide with nif11-like leader